MEPGTNLTNQDAPERDDTGQRMGAELVHLERELRGHGLSVADLLRSVAKHFHGVTVPPYREPVEAEPEKVE